MALHARIATALALVVVLGITGCASSTGSSVTQGGSASDGQALMEKKCTMCHSLDRINSAVYDKATWQATVDRMVASGLVVTAEEKQAIIDYLAERDAAR